MELYEAILNRRSIRKYKSTEVTTGQIEKIIKAGMYAPSAVNKQPWHFIVFRDKDKVKGLLEVHPNASMLLNSNVAVLVCWDEKLQHDVGYGQVDCSAATQNMLLAAHDMGLGAVWTGIYPREKRMDACRTIFNLPDHIHAFAIVSIGYPDEEKAMPERFRKERIHNEVWQGGSNE